MLGSKEISEILGVKPVTVRKYAQALEAAGYIIKRSDSGHREYTEMDATALRELQSLCERSGMTIENSAFIVAQRHKDAHASVSVALAEQEKAVEMRYESRYQEIVGALEQMQQQNERLQKRLDEQNNNISVILREVLETKKLLQEKNAKKWWKFWEKGRLDDDPNDPEVVWNMKKEKIFK